MIKIESDEELGNILPDEEFEYIMDYLILNGFSQMKKINYTDKEIEIRLKKMNNNKIFIEDDDLEEITSTWFIIDDELNLKTKKFENEKILTFDDKELLIEYAPKLFNNLKYDTQQNIRESIKKLKNSMFNLVDKVYEYRLNNSSDYILNHAKETFPTAYQKNTIEVKIQALEDNVSRLINLMGGTLLSTEKGYELKKQLKQVLINPSNYIPKRPTTTKNKEAIKTYLFSLKLEGKTEIIETFYTAIQ